MDLWDNALVNPPFTKDPPVKLNIPAKTIGLVIAILAGLGALGALWLTYATFTWASAATNLCNTIYGNVCPGLETHTTAIAGLGELIVLAGAVLSTWGGYQMYQENRQGKSLVIYGLVLYVVGNLLYSIFWGFGYAIGGFIIGLVIDLVIYYLIAISKFPGETPLVAQAPPGYGSPPPGYGAPPPPPAPPTAPPPPPPPAPPAS
jgi:hypothetical protein